MASHLLDNSEKYVFGEYVRLQLKSGISEISIATGYWDLVGMDAIFEELNGFLQNPDNRIRLLLGEEPSVRAYQLREPAKVDPNFPDKYLKRDLEDLDLSAGLQRVAQMLIDHAGVDNGNLEIRVFKGDFLHAKCYIFGSKDENAIGTIGSSNFTHKGLFGNLELNQVESTNATVNFERKNLNQHPSHRSWFEDLWERSEAWNRKFKEELLDLSKHGTMCFSPYEMYIHALYRVYGQELMDELSEEVEPNDPGSGKPQLLKFQIQNANNICNKLNRQSVAMLSDSVGLGKTYTAIKVIEHYLNRKNMRVVIVAPAGLVPQWRTALGQFKVFPIPELYSLQDNKQIEDVKNKYRSIPVGLFVFDESHNLRSTGGQRFDTFIKWRQDNPNAHVLLLTATPINNQLSDLTNQIMLGAGGEMQQLGRFFDRNSQQYYTLKERIELLQKTMRTQLRTTGEVNYPKIKEQLTPLLNRLIVRRTRQGIEKEYPDGLEINGTLQKFPKAYPENLLYEVPNKLRGQLMEMAKGHALEQAYTFEAGSFAEIEHLAHPLDLFPHCEAREKEIDSALEVIYTGILALGFPCYRYHIYRHAYHGKRRDELELNVDDNRELSRQIGIYGIFRTIFLKRLESSVHSVVLSLDSYERKLLDFKQNLEKHRSFISVKNQGLLNKAILSYNEQSAEEDELDFDIDAFEEGNEDFTLTPADPGKFKVEKVKADIECDLQVVAILRKQMEVLVQKDDKLMELAKHLNQNAESKVLIFTYYADTLKYLQDNLRKYLVKGQNAEFALGNKNEIENYAQRFAPRSKDYTLKAGEKEIDVLGATDKLSEGQNLQDCGMIINYDLHWNPVRMIQRNGRINRLGSRHKEIFVYNFRPTERLESYLQLVRKLETKINLIRYTIGSDQSILDEEPIPQDFTEDLYSKDAKKRLAAFEKIFEASELLAAEDLFMDDLREFHQSETVDESYKEQIRELPKGKWGRILKRNEHDDFTHLAHAMDEEGQAGYFISFKHGKAQEAMSATEGLLHIQCGKEQNERFKDRFANKPETERLISDFAVSQQLQEADYQASYTAGMGQAIDTIMLRMVEYQYPIEDIDRLNACLQTNQNAYINKQLVRILRDAARRLRRNQHLGSELIDELIDLAAQHRPEEKSEPIPIKEVIQIFA